MNQVKQSLLDLIPHHSGPLPPKLVEYADSIYKLSLVRIPKLPNQAEIGRYHFSAYVAIEHLGNSLDLPVPSTNQIPVPPKLLGRVLDDFLAKLLVPLTPKRNMVRDVKSGGIPNSSEVLKRLQTAAALENPEFRDVESPFNPKRKDDFVGNSQKKQRTQSGNNGVEPITDSPLTTPFRTPSKPQPIQSVNSSTSTPLKSPSKSPFKSPSKSPSKSPFKSKRVVQIPDFIAFANHFYIPADVTPLLLASFCRLQQKFAKKNEWLLACGIIHTAYVRINHKILDRRIGSRGQLQDQLFQYQKGGLMKPNMVIWCSIVDDMVHTEPWVSGLERQYGGGKQLVLQADVDKKENEARLGDEGDLEGLGCMVNASVMFTSKSQQEYYDNWTSRVYQKLQERGY